MISISKLRKFANLTASDDARLVDLRSTSVALFESLTGKRWQAYTNLVTEYELSHEFVRNLPLKTASSTVSLVEYLDDLAWEVLDADLYLVSNDRLRSSINLPLVLRVTATGGFADDAAPAQILEAISLQTRFLLERNQKGRLEIKSQNFEGGEGVLLEPGLHPFFRQVIDANRWRMP